MCFVFFLEDLRLGRRRGFLVDSVVELLSNEEVSACSGEDIIIFLAIKVNLCLDVRFLLSKFSID
jgi:hypothetical protein